MSCMAKFPHTCTGHLGCAPAHANWALWGRGHAHKSHDFAFAAMCHVAHQEIDAGMTMDKEQKECEWLLAYVATQFDLWENGKIGVL